MALFYKFDVNDNIPASPDDLALSANETADQASDARKSREVYENHVEKEIKHPLHIKFVIVPKSMILTCAVLSFAFLCVLLWEWDISREIYTVLFPQAPIFPFLVGVFCCFLASVCLGETSAHFRLSFLGDRHANNDEQKTKNIIGNLYDRSTKRVFVSSWFFHPAKDHPYAV